MGTIRSPSCLLTTPLDPDSTGEGRTAPQTASGETWGQGIAYGHGGANPSVGTPPPN